MLEPFKPNMIFCSLCIPTEVDKPMSSAHVSFPYSAPVWGYVWPLSELLWTQVNLSEAKSSQREANWTRVSPSEPKEPKWPKWTQVNHHKRS